MLSIRRIVSSPSLYVHTFENFPLTSEKFTYEGEHKHDKPHGKGAYTYANGDKYKGEFKDDMQHGKGTYTWANGAKYDGNYENDKKHGFGIAIIGGITYKGYWSNGGFLK